MMGSIPIIAAIAWGLSGCGRVQAGEAPRAAPPASIRVRAELPAVPGVADLKFRDFFAMPIGPRGLAPSSRLLALNGQRVRIVGYMARQDEPTPGLVILAPLPVVLGDQDESFADDLPASVVYVHLAEAHRDRAVPHLDGLLQFTGTLRLGAQREADGRVSFVRLALDAALSSDLADMP